MSFPVRGDGCDDQRRGGPAAAGVTRATAVPRRPSPTRSISLGRAATARAWGVNVYGRGSGHHTKALWQAETQLPVNELPPIACAVRAAAITVNRMGHGDGAGARAAAVGRRFARSCGDPGLAVFPVRLAL